MSTDLLFYAGLFFGVFLVFEGAFFMYYDWRYGTTRHVNRRIAMLSRGSDPESVLVALRRARESENRLGETVPVLGGLLKTARRADVGLTIGTVSLLLMALAAIIVVALARFTPLEAVAQIPIAVVCAYLAVRFWLKFKAKRRLDRFHEQLPDALDLIARSLRLGHPLSFSCSVVAREMPDPIGSEFGLASDEITYGMSVAEALDRLSDRFDSQDLRFLAVAVSIQAQGGGNLAEVIENLSTVVRSRFNMFRKINAITAEARWSGWFLSVFPVAMIFVVQTVRPDYFDALMEIPQFNLLALFAAFLLVVNILFMRMIVNIKV